jgi:hypothetical protein
MGGDVIRLPESADQCGVHTPRAAAPNGDNPASALQGHSTADDVILPQCPCIPAWICIPLCSYPFRPIGDDTVDDAFLLSRWVEDDHVAPPQLFDTAGGEHNPVPRPKERPHALSAAEDRTAGFFARFTHADFNPSKRGLSPFSNTSSIFSQKRPVRLRCRI